MSPGAGSLPENAFKQLVERLPGFSWIVSLDQGQPRLLYSSRPDEPLFNWVREKLAGDLRGLLDLIPPEDLPRLQDSWIRLLRGETVSREFHLQDANGRVHLVTGWAFPLGLKDFETPLIAGFCHNIAACSLRRQAEDALAWEARVNAALAEVSQAVLNSAPVEDISRLVPRPPAKS